MTSIRHVAVVALVAAFAGCAQEQPASPARGLVADHADPRGTGTVISIDFVAGAGRGYSPLGTVTGSVVGDAPVDRVGDGRTGRMPTALSAAGNPLAGNATPGRPESSPGVYRVFIQFPGGGDQIIEVFDVEGLRAGDRVRVDGNRISRD